MSSSNIQVAAICQICRWPIVDGQTVQLCPGCESGYHEACWNELGGCAAYGCTRMVEVKSSEDELITIWGMSEKVCPACAEKIPAAAMECPLCRTKFTGIRPMEPEELLRKQDDPEVVSYRRKAVWLLVFSVLGITSPLALIIGGIWYWSKKDRIEQTGPTVRGITLIALIISALYIGLVGFGLLVFWLKGVEG